LRIKWVNSSLPNSLDLSAFLKVVVFANCIVHFCSPSINCNCIVPNYPYEFLFFFFLSFLMHCLFQVFMHRSLKLEDHSNPSSFTTFVLRLKWWKPTTHQSNKTLNKGREKGYKMEKPKSWQMKNPPKKVDLRNLEQIKYLCEVWGCHLHQGFSVLGQLSIAPPFLGRSPMNVPNLSFISLMEANLPSNKNPSI